MGCIKYIPSRFPSPASGRNPSLRGMYQSTRDKGYWPSRRPAPLHESKLSCVFEHSYYPPCFRGRRAPPLFNHPLQVLPLARGIRELSKRRASPHSSHHRILFTAFDTKVGIRPSKTGFLYYFRIIYAISMPMPFFAAPTSNIDHYGLRARSIGSMLFSLALI